MKGCRVLIGKNLVASVIAGSMCLGALVVNCQSANADEARADRQVTRQADAKNSCAPASKEQSKMNQMEQQVELFTLISELQFGQKDYAGAEPLWRKYFQNEEECLTDAPAVHAANLGSFAECLAHQNKTLEAKKYYKKSIALLSMQRQTPIVKHDLQHMHKEYNRLLASKSSN